MINIEYKRNCVCQLAYHVVWCSKYRKKILVGSVIQRMILLRNEICNENKCVVISKEIQPDHIHLFVSIPASISIATFVKKIKGITARKLFLEFPSLKEKLCNSSLWSPSYYVGTAGNVSVETIKKYIEGTEHMRGRR